MIYKNFQDAYFNTIDLILHNGNDIIIRGNACKEIISCDFVIANPRDRLLNIGCRNKVVGKYIFGELLWYLLGRDDVEFIKHYSKVWINLSDDGITNNSAYGKYIFRPIEVNTKKDYISISQWDFVKSQLTKDPYTRQAIIHIKPIQLLPTKDAVCTICLNFYIRNNKLNLITVMRSNDVVKGLTYDVFMFTFLQELMAAELGIDIGIYEHYVMNMHIYNKDMELVNDMICTKNLGIQKMPEIPASFRNKDLPILLQIHNGDMSNYEQLSEVGKFLCKIGGKD